jgi:hypothetical protein
MSSPTNSQPSSKPLRNTKSRRTRVVGWGPPQAALQKSREVLRSLRALLRYGHRSIRQEFDLNRGSVVIVVVTVIMLMTIV